MAYTILTESYGRRLPKITATADSTDDLTALGVEFAEGSTVNVGGTVYSLDKVNGWIVPGSGGGGGGSGVFVAEYNTTASEATCDKTYAEVAAAISSGAYIFHLTSPLFPGVEITQQYVVVSDSSIEVHFFYATPNGSGGHNTTVYKITHTADSISVSMY